MFQLALAATQLVPAAPVAASPLAHASAPAQGTLAVSQARALVASTVCQAQPGEVLAASLELAAQRVPMGDGEGGDDSQGQDGLFDHEEQDSEREDALGRRRLYLRAAWLSSAGDPMPPCQSTRPLREDRRRNRPPNA